MESRSTARAVAVLLTLALAAGVPGPALAASAVPPPAEGRESEVIHYRWKILGLAGLVARFLFPARGVGELTTTRLDARHLASELRITADGDGDAEYWAYGSTIDPAGARVLAAWNSYSFRGRHKRKDAELEGSVIDVPSGIYLLRTDPPTSRRELRIWADGNVYPVTMVSGGTVRRRVADEVRELRHFWIEGRNVPGERRWKGRLEVWLTPDEEAVPVEILFKSRRGKVRLRQRQTPLD